MASLNARDSLWGYENGVLVRPGRLNASPELALVFPLITAFGLAILPMAWAAWCTGLVGIWAPVVVTLAVLTQFALPSVIPAVEFTALLILAIAFGYLGVRMARMSDDARLAPSVHRAERVVPPADAGGAAVSSAATPAGVAAVTPAEGRRPEYRSLASTHVPETPGRRTLRRTR